MMHYVHGKTGGFILALALIALLTRVSIPLASDAANFVANKS